MLAAFWFKISQSDTKSPCSVTFIKCITIILFNIWADLRMEHNAGPKHHYFYAVGVSYKKADAATRGKFSLDEAAKHALLAQAQQEGYEAMVVTSTCNRTEIYGFAEHPYQLIKLICDHSHGTAEEFQRSGFVYKNQEAVNHIFRVGTGLDSQILGDFEIISQLKSDFAESRKFHLIKI